MEGSSSLVIQNPLNNSFQTQGSVDWVSLGSKTVSFSVDMLSRMSQAGIDASTLAVGGHIVAQSLPLGERGLRNVKEALAALKAFTGLGKALWFGFGIRSFVRILDSSNEGWSLMAICSALSECFDEEFAAQVLYNIVHLQQVPEQFTPSLNQWFSVVRACAGIFSTTKFPLLADGFMRLGPMFSSRDKLGTMLPRISLPYQGLPSSAYRGSPSPKDLAYVIMELGKVARKEYDSISISGSTAVGWLAAITEWLYDLPFTLRGVNGEILHSNCTNGQEARIRMSFSSYDEMFYDDNNASIEVSSKTYELRDNSEIFHLKGQDSVDNLTVPSGRLPWRSCLTDVFGDRFTQLLSVGKLVGIACGCAASLLEGPMLEDPFVLDSSRDIGCRCRSLFSVSSGLGFIHTILQWFPELEELRTHMDKGLRVREPGSTYKDSLIEISQRCSCGCPLSPHNKRYCLLVIFGTIMVLCRLLSGVRVTENLRPTRKGVDMLYQKLYVMMHRKGSSMRERNFSSWQKTCKNSIDNRFRGGDMTDVQYSPWDFFSGFGDLFRGCLREAIGRTQSSCDENNFKWRMVGALQLFTGRTIDNVSSATIALCENGICAFLDILTSFSLDPDVVGLVRIVPGQIEKDNRPHRTLEDRVTLETEGSFDLMPRLMPLLQRKYRFQIDDVSTLFTETRSGLYVSFKFQDNSVKAGKMIKIGPGYLTSAVSHAREHVQSVGVMKKRCSHRMPGDNSELIQEIDHPYYKIDCRGYSDHLMAVVLTMAQDDQTVLAKLLDRDPQLWHGHRYWKRSVILCENDCLECFLNTFEDSLLSELPIVIFWR